MYFLFVYLTETEILVKKNCKMPFQGKTNKTSIIV